MYLTGFHNIPLTFKTECIQFDAVVLFPCCFFVML